MIRVVQITKAGIRRVALVDEPKLRLVDGYDSVYALVMTAAATGDSLSSLIREKLSTETLDYDPIYQSQSDWKLLVPLDEQMDPARTMVSGTGLTHFGSARDRQAMHLKSSASDEENVTDSMKMFRWGVGGGRPGVGKIGIAPEWFYKGDGTILRAHGQPLEVPPFAEDGGEEAEIVGLYLIGRDGTPMRIGMAIGNEFSDHLFEKKNYLNLAGSKLRNCSIGPELIIDPKFDSVPGEVSIERGGAVIWSKPIKTGESEMCHSLANIEHHHFKFDAHRTPDHLHIHFFGAHSLSYGDGIRLQEGDVISIRFDGFGRALRNPLKVAARSDEPIAVVPMK